MSTMERAMRLARSVERRDEYGSDPALWDNSHRGIALRLVSTERPMQIRSWQGLRRLLEAIR